MSSPQPSLPARVPRERKIAPLPLRARTKSKASASSSQDSLRSSTLSPPASSADHSIAFEVDEQGYGSQPAERQEKFTLRVLHNITPRPSLAQDGIPHPISPNSSEGLNHSSLPELATQDHEIPQPVHIGYSDEKIAISNANNNRERDVPMIAGDHSDGTATTSHPISLLNVLSRSQASELSPFQGNLHRRSISGASDVSDFNESNEITSPYDVRDEEAPLEPFFTPVFQTALQNGLGIANKVVTAIERLFGESKPSSDLERLFKDAKRLGTFQSSDTRTIAVLGDSGEGKSSLINSLLHFPDIAKTGDIGSACTSVVTEYRQKTRDHTSPITIEVDYLSKPEIEDLIEELLWNYHQIFLPEVEEDTVDPKDYARYQRESEQAWSALEAGFGHHTGFNKHLLSNTTEEGLAKATGQLKQWSSELQWPESGKPGTWKATADTAVECCEKTSLFMQDMFWPFTKIIRVYLNSQVLKTGVILADLPGLQDTNLARVRATQTYLMKCDNIFIVAKISRAVTDQSLKSSLYNILARHAPVEWEESAVKSLNLAVVCTKSEDINQKAARREFCSPSNKISPAVMEQLDKDIEDAKQNNNKVRKKILKRKQEFILIGARNSHVKEGLQKAYASKIPGGQLEVFCVSNTTYEKFSRKGNTEMVRASGVPELRRFCHKITAGAQLLEAKHFLQSTLASLLSSVELWASTSVPHPQVENREQDDSIYGFLKDVRAEVSKEIDQSRAEFASTFEEVLSEYLEQRNHSWEAAAEVKGGEWTSWHWTQYNAWCLNNGDHETAKRGYVNWNSDLIWKMRMELAYQWGLLEDEIPITFETLLKSIKNSLIKLQTYLSVQGFASTLVQGIRFRVEDMEYKFNLARQNFTREVKLVQRNASEPNQSSYVVSEMVPAYRAAARETGTGKAARQRSVVSGRISNGTLFPHISAKIQANIDTLVQQTFRDLRDGMGIILDLIVNDVEMALVSNPQHVNDSRVHENVEEGRRRADLMAEVMELNKRQEELLASISHT